EIHFKDRPTPKKFHVIYLQVWKKASTFSCCIVTENKHLHQPELKPGFSFSIGVGGSRGKLGFSICLALGSGIFYGTSPLLASVGCGIFGRPYSGLHLTFFESRRCKNCNRTLVRVE
ncbi:MAG: hypothetical protein EAS52_24270, partial [Parapedobacter sp.]